MRAKYYKHTLNFILPAGTSRGIYNTKDSWFLFLQEGENLGIGECSLLKGLSIDDRPDFEEKLIEVCDQINQGKYNFETPQFEFPAIQFGIETALKDLQNKEKHMLFPSDFTAGKTGIPTNGLIWMGNKNDMQKQIMQKLDLGFTCIKLKIGAIDWESERELIAQMRKQFSKKDLTIRVDANGAFDPRQAVKVLSELAKLQVHSIEQPIRAGQWEEMARLCKNTPTPIALDEELIGIYPRSEKEKLLETIQAQFIILKPGLLGGFNASDEWITLAEKYNIGWWATSALESNIGLNAIAQWVFTKKIITHQGLGTGMLFSNNISSPLIIRGEKLFYNPALSWDTV